MFYALTKNKQLIHINQALSTEQYFCPQCYSRLIIKQGVTTKKHFSHIKGKHHSNHDGESRQHYQAKQQLATQLMTDYQVKLEYRIEDALQVRIADICLMDIKYIIEFQQSTIAYSSLLSRHDFYIRHGYQVLWLLDDNLMTIKYGKIKLTKFIRSFIRKYQSYYYIVTYNSLQQQCYMYIIYPSSLYYQYVAYCKIKVTMKNLIKGVMAMPSITEGVQVTHKDKIQFMLQLIKYNQSVHHQLLKDIYQLQWT